VLVWQLILLGLMISVAWCAGFLVGRNYGISVTVRMVMRRMKARGVSVADVHRMLAPIEKAE